MRSSFQFSKFVNRRTLTLAAVLVAPGLLLSACLEDRDRNGTWRFGCIGDSNVWEGYGNVTWCSYVASGLTEVTINANGQSKSIPTAKSNFARIGATSCAPPSSYPYKDSGIVQTQRAIDQGDIDAVFIALGTNDFAISKTPAQIRRCLERLMASFTAAGIKVFVATVPPQYPADPATATAINNQIKILNSQIRNSFGNRVIEFNTTFTQRDFRDRLHFNWWGNQLAAKRVITAVKAEMNRQ